MAIQVSQSERKLHASQCAPEQTAHGQPERKPFKRLSKLQLFKTEMCKNYNTPRGCIYGDKCQYAHGLEDLRVRETPDAYKTRVCVTFAKTGRCPYGTRCRFVHGDADEEQILAHRRHAMERTRQPQPRTEASREAPSLLASSWACVPCPVPEATGTSSSPPMSPFSPVPLAEVTNCMPPALALAEEPTHVDAKNCETFSDEACPQIDLQALSLMTQGYLQVQERTHLPFSPEHNIVAALQHNTPAPLQHNAAMPPPQERVAEPLPLQRLGSSGASNSFRRYHNNVDAELQAPTLHVRETSFMRIVNRLADVLDDDADQLLQGRQSLS